MITGCVLAYGEQSVNIGRNAWLQAGLPFETPATTIDRQCGSAQQAVNFGASLIACGVHDVVIGGGVEHMGHVPMSSIGAIARAVRPFWPPELLERYNLITQGLSAELIAETWGISREECDAFGLGSQESAAQAAAEGRFDREIVAVEVNGSTVTTDQGIRPETTLAGLAELNAAFKPDGRHTAGNSSQVSDGASAVLLASRETAAELGLRARARVVDQLTVGVDPVLMLTGPIPATTKILERNGLTLADVDLVEINEAFAAVDAARGSASSPDMEQGQRQRWCDRARPPARLDRREADHNAPARAGTNRRRSWGLVTMCCGGGFGTATLIERI